MDPDGKRRDSKMVRELSLIAFLKKKKKLKDELRLVAGRKIMITFIYLNDKFSL